MKSLFVANTTKDMQKDPLSPGNPEHNGFGTWLILMSWFFSFSPISEWTRFQEPLWSSRRVEPLKLALSYRAPHVAAIAAQNESEESSLLLPWWCPSSLVVVLNMPNIDLIDLFDQTNNVHHVTKVVTIVKMCNQNDSMVEDPRNFHIACKSNMAQFCGALLSAPLSVSGTRQDCTGTVLVAPLNSAPSQHQVWLAHRQRGPTQPHWGRHCQLPSREGSDTFFGVQITSWTCLLDKEWHSAENGRCCANMGQEWQKSWKLEVTLCSAWTLLLHTCCTKSQILCLSRRKLKWWQIRMLWFRAGSWRFKVSVLCTWWFSIEFLLDDELLRCQLQILVSWSVLWQVVRKRHWNPNEIPCIVPEKLLSYSVFVRDILRAWASLRTEAFQNENEDLCARLFGWSACGWQRRVADLLSPGENSLIKAFEGGTHFNFGLVFLSVSDCDRTAHLAWAYWMACFWNPRWDLPTLEARSIAFSPCCCISQLRTTETALSSALWTCLRSGLTSGRGSQLGVHHSFDVNLRLRLLIPLRFAWSCCPFLKTGLLFKWTWAAVDAGKDPRVHDSQPLRSWFGYVFNLFCALLSHVVFIFVFLFSLNFLFFAFHPCSFLTNELQ